MDFSTTIVEAGATLRDPHFAFGFFVTAVLLGAASFSAVILWRHENPKLRTLSVAAALIKSIYVWSVWGLAGSALLAAVVARTRERESGTK